MQTLAAMHYVRAPWVRSPPTQGCVALLYVDCTVDSALFMLLRVRRFTFFVPVAVHYVNGTAFITLRSAHGLCKRWKIDPLYHSSRSCRFITLRSSHMACANGGRSKSRVQRWELCLTAVKTGSQADNLLSRKASCERGRVEDGGGRAACTPVQRVGRRAQRQSPKLMNASCLGVVAKSRATLLNATDCFPQQCHCMHKHITRGCVALAGCWRA